MLVCVRIDDVLVEQLFVPAREASKVRYGKKRQAAYCDRVEVKGKQEKARGCDSYQNWVEETTCTIAPTLVL